MRERGREIESILGLKSVLPALKKKKAKNTYGSPLHTPVHSVAGDEDAWTKLDEHGQRIAFLFACARGFKAAEPFLQTLRGRMEAGGDTGGTVWSPLQVAILSGDSHLCSTLVQSGADVNKALEREQAEWLDAVGRKGISGFTGATPLHLALAFDCDEFVQKSLLNSGGLNLQACDAANRTALHYAALLGKVATFKTLVSSQKIDFGVCDKDGLTALHIAAAANSTALLDILLQSVGNDIKVPDAAGRTALHVAAASGNLGNVKALIPWMIQEVQQADKSGKIPLIHAIDSYQPQVISELLEEDRRDLRVMGAVTVGQSITLKTPLHYAVHTTRKKGRAADHKSMLLPLLRYATYRTREMFHLFWDDNALLYRHAKHVRVQQLLATFLPNRGSDKRNYWSTDETDETSLQRAAKAGYVHLTRMLLDKEPDFFKDLNSSSWTARLIDGESEVVLNVKRSCYIELMRKAGDSSLMEEFCRQATDQPSLDDCLGRRALVEGLAALLLNPYTGTPLTIGIYGEWGHGKSSLMQQSDEAVLEYFVDNYDPRHHEAYRSLALTDTSGLLKSPQHREDTKSIGENSTRDNQRTDPSVHQPRTPAVLTVWYNAWRYQDETEALAGLAVEIIKVMESTMNMALWMSICWRYAWRRNRQEIYQRLFFPVVLAALLSVFFSIVLWKLLSMSPTLKGFKYTAPPVCFVLLLWTVFVKVYDTVQPVSSKIFSYFNPMQHESKLGYQHEVINDIKFMMTALRSKSPLTIWRFLAKLKWIWVLLGLEDHDFVAGTHIFKQSPASDMRIVVLVDDLDRCRDETILKVLSVINLVLAVCEINVILGIDKGMIYQALKNELFKGTDDSLSTEYVQRFLQKIVQLPITLPDPTNKRMGQFLARQMGFAHQSEKHNKLQRWGTFSSTIDSKNDEDDATDMEDNDFRGVVDPDNHEELNNTLLARYTAQECNILVLLQGFSERDKRLPREWKRFLNYHRFACNILSKDPATETFPDWNIELLVWVFVCWQWKDLIDMIIQHWRSIGEAECKIERTKERGEHEGVDDKEKYSKIPQEIVEESTSEDALTKGKSTASKDRNDERPTLQTIVLIFLRLRIIKAKNLHQSSEDHKDHHQSSNEDENHHQSWQSLLRALKCYDVSMEGILMFQDFRFHCEHGVLSWPVTEEHDDAGGMRRLISNLYD